MRYLTNSDKINSIYNGNRHDHQKVFKVFPFVTNSSNEPITNFNQIIGGYINRIRKTEPVEVHFQELIDQMKLDITIKDGKEELFEEVIRFMFFDEHGQLIQSNLRTMAQNDCKNKDENRLVDYLVDVLGDPVVLKAQIDEVFGNLNKNSNVLEKSMFSYLKTQNLKEKEENRFYRVIDLFKDVYEKDFAYMLSSLNGSGEQLVTLLEFYYFVYTVQACLQLEEAVNGNRTKCIPLYFALDWEKSNQSRLCYIDGWNKKIEPVIKKMYAHTVALAIINLKEDSTPIGYRDLLKMAKKSTEDDAKVASELRKLTYAYRELFDCEEMTTIKRDTDAENDTAQELKFLVDSIVCQFLHSGREAAYKKYPKPFLEFADKFLKNRGRSGRILNITEDMLIFLTKIVIKDEEKMRLNDVFKEFEQRGVFFDNLSKEQVMKYYEKLNLIEKKSDSGDAQYVKRIL